jgi:hypothetical protein
MSESGVDGGDQEAIAENQGLVALFGYKVEAQQGELETFAIGIALGVLHW